MVQVRSRVGLGWPKKNQKPKNKNKQTNTSRVTSQPVFISGKKKGVRVRYFSGRVRKILTHFAISKFGHVWNFWMLNSNLSGFTPQC